LNDLPPLEDRQQRRLLRGGHGVEMNGRNDTILSTWDFNQTQPSVPISPSSTTTFNHYHKVQEKLLNVQKKLGPTALVDQGSEGGGGGHGRRGIVHGEKLVVVEKEAKGEREGEREERGREKNFTVLAPLPPSVDLEEKKKRNWDIS
jgi:hypothetical protein